MTPTSTMSAPFTVGKIPDHPTVFHALQEDSAEANTVACVITVDDSECLIFPQRPDGAELSPGDSVLLANTHPHGWAIAGVIAPLYN